MLVEFDVPPVDPLGVLRAWIDGAVARGVREPWAVTLATSDRTGDVTSRTVLIKGVEQGALLFTSHRGSAKGRQLTDNARASVTFYWRETLQQINVAGRVEVVSDERSDQLFAERPVDARAATAVSRQSEVLRDEGDLQRRAVLAVGAAIARPVGWVGYALVPERIEFWYGRPDRLHRRLRYERRGDQWTSHRLQP